MSLFNKLFGMFSSTRTSVSKNTNVSMGRESVSVVPSLSTMKVAELRVMARTMGLSGYSSMRKADLVSYIEQNQA